MAIERTKTSLLFVCTGNICRSPSADGVFKALVEAAGLEDYFYVDSAGTHAETGWPADRRSAQVAESRGYSLDGLVARQIVDRDFELFDYIFSMDEGHQRYLERMQPKNTKAKVALFLPFAFGEDTPEYNVGDPYYGGEQGFIKVFEQIELGCQQILEQLKDLHVAPNMAQNNNTKQGVGT